MTVRLGELTGDQAQAALVRNPVILLPLGSHESHGPGLPMGDYLAADVIATRIADRATQAGTPCLVAPVLPFGGADFFGSVPGAIALSQATFRAVLTDMLAALLRNNLTRLLILNGHGGNSQAIHEVTLALRRSHGAIIPSLYLWKAAHSLLAPDAATHAGHGADPMASIALHLTGLPTPTPVPFQPRHILNLPISGFATATFGGLHVDMPLELADIAPAGVAPGADPSQSSAERGAQLTDQLVAIGAALASHIAASVT
jgi:creatinine amidohydrolase